MSGPLVVLLVALCVVPLALRYRSWLNADLESARRREAGMAALERTVNRVHGRRWDG